MTRILGEPDAIRRTLCAFAVVLLASSAGAQTADERLAAQGRWTLDCSAEPQTHENWCQVGTVLESRVPPVSLEFNYVRDTGMFFARGSVPLSAVRVHVDGQPAFDLDRCLHGMCLLKGDAAEKLLLQMLAGTRLTLAFESGQRVPGPLTVELAGFTPMVQRALAAPK